MRQIRCLLLAILVMVVPAMAGAEDDASGEVKALLAAQDQFASRFEQAVHSQYGELIEYAAGSLVLDGERFRWSVEDPYPQVIVSDGSTLRIYDPDLEQVTERDLQTALAGTPLGLLTGDLHDLDTAFAVSRQPTEDQSHHFVLISLSEDSPYRRIELWASEQRLQRLVVLDHFQQKLTVQFTADPFEMPEPLFELQLPEGVEVVRG